MNDVTIRDPHQQAPSKEREAAAVRPRLRTGVKAGRHLYSNYLLAPSLPSVTLSNDP